MKSIFLKSASFAFLLGAIVPSISTAGLVGTQLTLSGQTQATPTSQLFTTSFPRTALVSSTAVEFPDVASLFNPNDPRPPGFGNLVNTWIDAGDDYIEIDFFDAGRGSFARGHLNSYVFQFDSEALATITGASINTAVTTLGLSASNVSFASNMLFVNLQGLSFNPNSFLRIDMNVIGGPAPIPEPAPYLLFATGLMAIFAFKHKNLSKNSSGFRKRL